MPEESIRFPGAYILSNGRERGSVHIHTVTTGEILPLRMGTIAELNIYEDINRGALTGSMIIVDSSNIIAKTPLQGNERISFKLSTPMYAQQDDRKDVVIDASEDTGHPFYIYAITNRHIESETVTSYKIDFCSREMLRSARTRVSRAYDGSLEQAAIRILRDKDGLDSLKKFTYEPTRNSDKIVIPNMRPLDAMNLLCDKALSKNTNGAGYYFYETTKGFHFRSYESMLAEQGHQPRQPKLILNYRPFQMPYENKILENMHNVESFEFLQHFDTLSQQAMGTYASKVITYNIYDKNYSIADYAYHDHFFRHFHADHMGNQSSLNYHVANAPIDNDPRYGGNVPGRIGDKTVSDYHDSKIVLQPSTRYLHNENTGVFGTNTENEGMTEAIRISQDNQVNNSTKLQITMAGHSYLQAGDVVKFNLPSFERNKQTENKGYEYDEKHSGRYVVTKVRHRLQQMEYRMILELTKDSVYTPYESKNIYYPGSRNERGRSTLDLYEEDKGFYHQGPPR